MSTKSGQVQCVEHRIRIRYLDVAPVAPEFPPASVPAVPTPDAPAAPAPDAPRASSTSSRDGSSAVEKAERQPPPSTNPPKCSQVAEPEPKPTSSTADASAKGKPDGKPKAQTDDQAKSKADDDDILSGGPDLFGWWKKRFGK